MATSSPVDVGRTPIAHKTDGAEGRAHKEWTTLKEAAENGTQLHAHAIQVRNRNDELVHVTFDPPVNVTKIAADDTILYRKATQGQFDPHVDVVLADCDQVRQAAERFNFDLPLYATCRLTTRSMAGSPGDQPGDLHLPH